MVETESGRDKWRRREEERGFRGRDREKERGEGLK